jgi:uncharacterized membrane protein
MSALLALVAAIGWGSSDFAAGLASRKSSATSVVIVTHFVSAVLLSLFLFGGQRAPSATTLVWSVLAGASGGFGGMMLYRGLARGTMAVVASITAVGAAALPAVWGIATGDKLTTFGALALVLALAAITLVSASAAAEPVLVAAVFKPVVAVWPPISLLNVGYVHRLDRIEQELVELRSVFAASLSPAGASLGPFRLPTTIRAGVPDALMAGLGFGMFFVLIDRAGSDTGLWPMAVARCVSVVLLTIGAVATSSSWLPERGSRLSVVVAGVLDAVASIAFLAAARTGLLSVVAVLSSLYPGVTVLLARAFANERLVRRQLMGLSCAGAAVVLFAMSG